ncbi:hypothetical protein Rhal01_00783 [Rubritalea halochordaticola]|uniref:mannosyl-oligosaccharide glucosidase n=1 Tax=Rubritalea halochordaticola TaxID=714537 RepID=A0ABP9UY40_9BACT
MKETGTISAERKRLVEDGERSKNWKRWGPYLAERQWGTVREDYSDSGDVWHHFTHDHARSRTYRWGEDGLLGWSDRKQRINFAPIVWNGKDPILKERLFGLSGPQGNHGEDVKECYYYLNNTPTHSYSRALYKYPMERFPYSKIVEENASRSAKEPEYGLIDTGVFDEGEYWDVETIVAKAGPQDMCWTMRVTNRSDHDEEIHILPSVWFRNSWGWNGDHFEGDWGKPEMYLEGDKVIVDHPEIGKFHFYVNSKVEGFQDWLFTENETNMSRLYGGASKTPYTKDGFHEYLIRGKEDAVNPEKKGTKVAAWMTLKVPAGETKEVQCRLIGVEEDKGQGFKDFDKVLKLRAEEEVEFYDEILPENLTTEERRVAIQGYAGLLWSKQFYYYIVDEWRTGDNGAENASPYRMNGRNKDWEHLFARDVLSMPDKWEYPWFASWDSAFHMVAFARVDPHFAKKQLLLFMREWYLHPNGQIPAYEWNFSDVNPPVHAWAVWQTYQILQDMGQPDLEFLEKAVQKLFLNFTWWVNQKDVDGVHLFSGGFLGLDNIGVFDRSQELGDGARLIQADGTAWMGAFCAKMLVMTLELAKTRPVYEDMASKFFEHFVRIARAANEEGGDGLWDDEDCFYYDHLMLKSGDKEPLKVRSMVGLLPLTGVAVLDLEEVKKLPGFEKRLNWFMENQSDLAEYASYCDKERSHAAERLLALPTRERFEAMLDRMLDPEEFLSDHGLRSLSKYHGKHPYSIFWGGEKHSVSYVPGESDGYMFGGNSNWRGPVWFPVNYMVISALRQYQCYYGDAFKVEFPKGSGDLLTLNQVADALTDRLVGLFLPDEEGKRPCFGDLDLYKQGGEWQDLVYFYEYFHGESGVGLGASHQTGWTSLVVPLMCDRAKRLHQTPL